MFKQFANEIEIMHERYIPDSESNSLRNQDTIHGLIYDRFKSEFSFNKSFEKEESNISVIMGSFQQLISPCESPRKFNLNLNQD